MKGIFPALCSAMALPDGEAAPEWLHLLPAGDVRTVDGRGPYRLTDPAAVVTASMAGGKLVLDENHSTDLAAPKGDPAPARAWIVELASRDDGIWGRVQWTAEAVRTGLHQAYRGVSPAIVHRRDGTIVGIARASLTNTPNLAGLVALHHTEKTMDFRAWLIEALGLAADVDDAAIQAALQKALKGEDKGAAVALQSALNPIAAIVGVAAGADAATVLAGVQRLKAAGTDSDAITALQSALTDTTAKLKALSEATSRKDAVAFVDGAIAAGHVGVKPLRDRYISMHMADAAGTEELVRAMPTVTSGATLGGDPPSKDKNGLGAADQAVIALMGIDPAEYAKTLAAQDKGIAA